VLVGAMAWVPAALTPQMLRCLCFRLETFARDPKASVLPLASPGPRFSLEARTQERGLRKKSVVCEGKIHTEVCWGKKKNRSGDVPCRKDGTPLQQQRQIKLPGT
jgi:hypothetical protein